MRGGGVALVIGMSTGAGGLNRCAAVLVSAAQRTVDQVFAGFHGLSCAELGVIDTCDRLNKTLPEQDLALRIASTELTSKMSSLWPAGFRTSR